MDDSETLNPIFEGHDLTRLLTFSGQQSERRKPNVPAAVGRIIGELGLRYRPALAADLEAHARTLKLLTEDVADIPPNLLEAAAKRWVRENRFMPKASELVALARGQLAEVITGTDAAVRQLEDHCARLNAMNCDWHWAVVGEASHRRVERIR